MQVVNSLEEESWRRFIDDHPESNIFHTPEMFQVFATARNHRPTLWAATDDDGRVLALLLPVLITLTTRLCRLTTRAVAYGSALCAPGPKGQEALTLLLRTYLRQVDGAPLFTELRNLSDLSVAQPALHDCGFVYEDHLNYLIDLDHPLEEVMRGIGRRTRKHIRRGLKKQDVVIEEVTERSQVEVCHHLLRKSFTEARVPLADLSLLGAAFDILYPQGMIKFWLARVKDTYIATSIELLYKDIVYGWYGGVDRAYSNQTPGELLMWHVLQWGNENHFRLYDFGGAGKPGEEYGVRDFKAKFGGKLVCYGRNTYVHSPALLRLSKMGYTAYQWWLRQRPL
jgi:hypothetical protein